MKRKKERGIRDRGMVVQSYLMLLPQIIGFCVLIVYPLFWAVRLAWYSYDGNSTHTIFVGWQNFITLFTRDTGYWEALANTFLFAILKIPLELPLALIIAVVLNSKLRGRNAFRMLYFLPTIISVAIVGIIFSNIFDYFGVINGILKEFGIIKENIDWFSQKHTAMAVLVLASIWQTLGINMMYFLAALQNVPADVYECAKIDGANGVTVFFRITIPLIMPVAQTILLLSMVGTLQTNDLILVLTNGAPGGQTFTVMPYLTSNFVPGFADVGVNIGYGCALAVVTAVIFAFVSLIYMRLSNKISQY